MHHSSSASASSSASSVQCHRCAHFLEGEVSSTAGRSPLYRKDWDRDRHGDRDRDRDRHRDRDGDRECFQLPTYKESKSDAAQVFDTHMPNPSKTFQNSHTTIL
jgi:hypothetical protein